MIEVPPGGLYLGETIDPATRDRTGEPVPLDSCDLTTHGVIVGMTGSGKMGLGVVLVEEALLAGIPTLVVDPKGDLGNLALTFPELRPDDLAPWVEGGHPAAAAARWSEGWAAGGIDTARVAARRDAAELTVYTPGSTSGVPLNVIGSLRRPADGTDDETVADEVEGYVTGLLGMVGIESDPLSGREHILLSNLIHHAWASGTDLDLATLVAGVQDPPLRRRAPVHAARAGLVVPVALHQPLGHGYLRGPLTREQISTLMADRRAAPSDEAVAAASPAATPTPDGDAVPVAPPVAEGVPVRWLDPAAPWAAQAGTGAAGAALAPALVARVSSLFDDDKLGLRQTEEYEAVVHPLGQTVDPAAAVAVDHDDRDLCTEAPAGALYRVTDALIGSRKFFGDAEKALVDHLYRSRTTQVLRNEALKLAQRVGETADEFAIRCQAAADDEADKAQVKLQQNYEARITRARAALDTAADRVDQAEAAQQTRRSREIVSGAGSLLGAVLGGPRGGPDHGREAGRVLTGRTRRAEASQRVETARNRVGERHQALADLEAGLARDLTAIDDEWRAKAAAVEAVDVPLEKSDIRVTALSLVWVPAG
jgi:hypothetical protein